MGNRVYECRLLAASLGHGAVAGMF